MMQYNILVIMQIKREEKMVKKELVKREFKYEVITLQDIYNNSHLIFICDGDNKKIKIESREENEY